jgi:hypothetical protein
MSIYDKLNIPFSCKIGNTVFKKLFYESTDLSIADKELFTDTINKVTWFYCLKPDTINIQAYKDEVRDYQEIEVIEVAIKEDKKVKRIAEIIMHTIPYPMLLIFKLEEKTQLYVAHQRINQNDSNKNTLEELVFTEWLDDECPLFQKFDIKQMRFTNYYTLYCDIVDTISIYNASNLIKAGTQITGEQARKLTDMVEQLEQQIESLRAKLKKETQFNRRVEMNIEIKRLKKIYDERLAEL